MQTNTITSMQEALKGAGFLVGARDLQRNTDFPGLFMVAEVCEAHELPTRDASRGGWCVVGDNLDELMVETCEAFGLGN